MTTNQDTLDAALAYAAQGFAVFPVHGISASGGCTCTFPACKKPGKHPVYKITPHGLTEATKDPARIQAMWALATHPVNVAIATGTVSGIWVLDLDGPVGEASYDTLVEKYGQSNPITLESITGRGRHLFFTYPNKEVRSRTSNIAEKIDIRGNGGYVVAPPSMHQSGRQYRWDIPGAAPKPAAAWLVEEVTSETPPKRPALARKEGFEEKWPVSTVQEMLATISPNLPYSDWLEVGMALHDGGYPVTLWDEWSKPGTSYPDAQIDRHWNSFRPERDEKVTMGSLYNRARLAGWKPAPPPPLDLATHPAAAFIGRIGGLAAYTAPLAPAPEIDALAAKLPTPTSPTAPQPPDLIRDTVAWICRTAPKPQPELAMLNVLAALGAVMGRRYAGAGDIHTNVYFIGLAPTGSGKDWSRKQIKRLMAEAGYSDLLGGDSIVSAAGLLRGLQDHPSQISHLDEIGMLLQSIADPNGANHMRPIAKVLTQLYSDASSSYNGGTYSDRKVETISIPHPNLCIYGTSTVEEYAKALSKRMITSGELNRFIVMETTTPQPKRNRNRGGSGVPSDLVAAWRALTVQHGQGNLQTAQSAAVAPEIYPVLLGDCEARVQLLGDYEDEQAQAAGDAGPLWMRYTENVIKVATICAVARNPQRPVIQYPDIEFAEYLIGSSITFVRNMVGQHMADTNHEADCQAVIRAITKAGGSMRGRDLNRAIKHMDNKRRDAAIRSLQDQERIDMDPAGIAGVSGKIYRIVNES